MQHTKQYDAINVRCVLGKSFSVTLQFEEERMRVLNGEKMACVCEMHLISVSNYIMIGTA